jgi:ATP-binding cassette subfamily B protein
MSIPSLTGVIVIAILAYLGTQVFHTPGIKLVAFFYIFMRFAQSVSESIQIISFFKLSLEGLKKLYQWSIKQDPSIPSNYSAFPSNEKQIKISAKNIGFSYEEKTIFKDVNLDITTGDILLIKGKSGSGKSTLLNVLAGMYKPTEGQIFYNDAAGAPANIAELIGYVGPDPYLVHGTIKENLMYGLNQKRDESQLINCLNKSHMLEIVNALPLKMETVLSDAAELSTGQKQRLSIARALLRNPKILILDEATSNLDSTTEKQIIANIQELSRDLIILVISHHDSFDSIATQKLSM